MLKQESLMDMSEEWHEVEARLIENLASLSRDPERANSLLTLGSIAIDAETVWNNAPERRFAITNYLLKRASMLTKPEDENAASMISGLYDHYKTKLDPEWSDPSMIQQAWGASPALDPEKLDPN